MTRRRARAVPAFAAAALAVAAMAVPALALAQSGAALGESSRAGALALAVVAAEGDLSTIYINPATLTDLDAPTVSLFGSGGRLDLWEARAGEPRNSHDRTVGGYGFAIGAPMSGPPALAALHVALSIYTPAQHALRIDSPERTDDVGFPLYGGRLEHLSANTVFAYEIADWLSVGGGFVVTPTLWAPTEVEYVAGRGDTPEESLELHIYRELRVEVAPSLGLRLSPLSWLAAGAAWRARQVVRAHGPNDVIAGGVLVDDELDFYDFWSPDELSFGLAATPSTSLTTSLDLVWSLWSNYRTFLDRDPEPSFRDVLLVRCGVEWEVLAGIDLRAGWALEPTPVPEQTSVTNLIDGSRHVTSLGAGFDLDALGAGGFVIDVHARAHWMSSVESRKDPELLPDADALVAGMQIDNLGYPEIAGGGRFWQVGLTTTFPLRAGGDP